MSPLIALLLAIAPATDSFPHAAHRRLFASCTTCHAGIASADTATARPPAPSCASCHDGTRERRVEWNPAPPRPTNLRFDHGTHARTLAARRDSALGCVGCHATAGASVFMEAGPAQPERCLSCHAHRAPAHLAAADCSSCHRPLATAARLTTAEIARIPKPATHDAGYVFRHRDDAGQQSCAFCHTRESCASCHVDAARQPAIRALGTDARVAAIAFARGAPDYPVPASHRDRAFISMHGTLASSGGATCASCHTRESCVGCHATGERLRAITALPARSANGAAGVDLDDRRPPDHGAGFAVRHGEAAGGGEATCAGCHAPSFCTACHDSGSKPPFHARDFVSRHGAESFGSTTECATCHQTEAFCVSCHRETGRASQTGAATGAYHDAQSNWAFAHGVVARRSIESCAGCHRQADCLACHSAVQGWGVNPHGRGFDPGLAPKNRALCARCHGNNVPVR